MSNRNVLSATGAVQVEHRLSRAAVSIRAAQDTITRHKASLCSEQAARFDAIELTLSSALENAKQSLQLYRMMRPLLRPMNASEQRLIEELANNRALPQIPK
ncbi:hypothetical protein BG58_03895 [Caballeronia jiangsuensis]|nr:hypothetical protein BG58_03895 [Caballeronia jiangsuensis]